MATNTRLSATVEAALRSTVGLRQLIGSDRSGSVRLGPPSEFFSGTEMRPDCASAFQGKRVLRGFWSRYRGLSRRSLLSGVDRDVGPEQGLAAPLAVSHPNDLPKDRNCRLGRRLRLEIEPDGSVDLRDLFL